MITGRVRSPLTDVGGKAAAARRIQAQVNRDADAQGRPHMDLINEEEQARILALMEASTWPERWTGHQVRGNVLIPHVMADGVMQPLLLDDMSGEVSP